MADNRKKIKKQTEFCKELMDRLSASIDENVDMDSSWWGIRNHTQISCDIIRLRRELHTLNKLLNPYGD